MNGRAARLALGLWLLATLAGADASGSRDAGDPHTRAQSVLADLRLQDARLTDEVLDARANLVFGYDGLVRIQRETETLIAKLAQEPLVTEPGIASAFAELDAARRHKAELVERFKSENAILRNSRHYLPALSAQLDSAIASGAVSRSTATIVAQLLEDTATYGREGGVQGRDELETTAFLLSGSGNDESLVETAAIHAQILLDHAPVVDRLVAEIRACPTQAGVEKLRYALDQRSARLSRQRGDARTAAESASASDLAPAFGAMP
ncbi:MAG: DAHL domain-containing protein [Myxococcota bacterium]